MISKFLLLAVLILLAKRLLEVVILILQRLGRQTNAGAEVLPNDGCVPEIGKQTTVEQIAG